MMSNDVCSPIVLKNKMITMEAKQVLIVDDEEDHRMVLSDLLESQGYSTSSVKNAKQAMAELSTQVYDLVITDFMMPEMNGLELIRAMVMNERLSMIPVILLTANSRENLEDLAKSAGAFSTVFKPFDNKSLLDLIQSAIKQSPPVSSKFS